MKKVVIAASMLIVLTSLLVGKSITIHSQVEGIQVYLNEIYLGETIYFFLSGKNKLDFIVRGRNRAH